MPLLSSRSISPACWNRAAIACATARTSAKPGPSNTPAPPSRSPPPSPPPPASATTPRHPPGPISAPSSLKLPDPSRPHHPVTGRGAGQTLWTNPTNHIPCPARGNRLARLGLHPPRPSMVTGAGLQTNPTHTQPARSAAGRPPFSVSSLPNIRCHVRACMPRRGTGRTLLDILNQPYPVPVHPG